MQIVCCFVVVAVLLLLVFFNIYYYSFRFLYESIGKRRNVLYLLFLLGDLDIFPIARSFHLLIVLTDLVLAVFVAFSVCLAEFYFDFLVFLIPLYKLRDKTAVKRYIYIY